MLVELDSPRLRQVRLQDWADFDEPVDRIGSLGAFEVSRHHRIGSHYVRTLNSWAKVLHAHRAEAIALRLEQVCQRYRRYFIGGQELFGDGHTDVCQFTLTKPG